MTTRARAAVAMAAGALLLVAAGCAGSNARTAPRRPAAATRRSTDVLGASTTRTTIPVSPYERQAFLELAVQPAVEFGDRVVVLERWNRDPRIAVSGAPTPEDLRHLDEATVEWSLITHRHLVLTDGPADVTVHFVPRAQFADVLGGETVDPSAVGLTRVSFAPGHRGAITGGVVVIASDDDQVTRNRTIAHELGHAMGLQHSTCPSSLMDGSSDGERSVRWTPSAFDIRMGQLLYDPRLAAGETRPTVEAILSPTTTDGAICGPVDLELVRATGSGRHYFCVRSSARVRPCTSDVTTEPTLPLRHPDAWTDGESLSASPEG